MKASLTVTDTDDGGVEISLEAVEGSFAKDGEVATPAESLISYALTQVSNIIKGEIT